MSEQPDRLCVICQHSGYDHLNADSLGRCGVSGCDCEQFNLPSRGLWAGVSLADLAYLLELSTAPPDAEKD
jgi:hypothetical protein